MQQRSIFQKVFCKIESFSYICKFNVRVQHCLFILSGIKITISLVTLDVSRLRSEPKFVNASGAQESIPVLLNRLQIQALIVLKISSC
jgi:hypothetical protein